jgi:hypothetical protein
MARATRCTFLTLLILLLTPLSFGVRVRGDEIEISAFAPNEKGDLQDRMKFGKLAR